MKTAFAAVIILAGSALLLFAGSGAAAQAQASPAQRMQPAQQPQQTEPSANNLNAILQEVQQATSSTNVNIGKLRIERWKTDAEQKQQLQQIAESLQKNIANALPGMVTDVQSSHGSVATSFKLYHNLNVLYENLNYLADVAGSLGKKEEFEPLAADCASLESARKNLSIYIEQAAVRLESAQ
jgi:ubiquinone biosynthesis protein UbiJ